MIHLAFESTAMSVEKNRETVRVSYYSSSSKEELEQFVDQNYKPGSISTRGSVENVHYRQKGPIWYVDISCYTNYSPEIGISLGGGHPQKHSLRSVRISMPLEQAPGYKTKWDHYLWCRIPVNYESAIDSIGTPPEYGTATTDMAFSSNGFWWRWSKTADEVDATSQSEYFWKCMTAPTKPGVDSWDHSTYQIVEYGEYPNEKQAAWITAILVDRIRTTPLLGDFGLGTALGSGFNWKCDDASVEYDGKKWRAQMVWTLSGDNNGWDLELYSTASR